MPPKKSLQTALITGASSGIGYELSKLFARDGYHLVLVARDKQRLIHVSKELEEKFNIRIKIIATDLADPGSPEKIFTELQKENIHINVLVNNAGFATYGLFSETDLKTELEMIQTNITTLTHLSKLFLKEMLKTGQGKILNVASTAAFQPGPLMAVYYATKAYVLSFSQALTNECQGTGINITVLCPGPTATGFQKKAHLEKSKLFQGAIMDAATVAKAGYAGLIKNKSIVIPGFKNKFLATLASFIPRNIAIKIVRNIQEKR